MAYNEREKRFFVKGVNHLHEAIEDLEQAWFTNRDPRTKAILDLLRRAHSDAADLHCVKLKGS